MTACGLTRVLIALLLGVPAPAFAQTPNFLEPAAIAGDLAGQQSAALATIRGLPTTEDVQVVRLNPSALSRTTIELPNASQSMFTVKNVNRDTRGDRLLTWSGEVLAPSFGERTGLPGGVSTAGNITTMVVDGNNVTASIQGADGLYRISPLGSGLHAYVKVNPARFPAEHPPSFSEKSLNLRDIPPFPRKDPSDHSITTISVLVAYTPAVEKKVVDVRGLVQLAFAEANQSYKNSDIYINLVPAPVNPIKVNYTEGGSMDAELAAFAAMSNIQQVRGANHSNIALLLVDDPSYCGLAQSILATKATAYAVVYWDCATGYYSFAHEIGHLQGARHNPEMDNAISPFPYGHGFMDPANHRRTIMSYDCPGGCVRKPEWARPSNWGNISTSNDARVLNETATYISSFR